MTVVLLSVAAVTGEELAEESLVDVRRGELGVRGGCIEVEERRVVLDHVVCGEGVQVDDPCEPGPPPTEDDGEDAEDEGDGVGDMEDVAYRLPELSARQVPAVMGSIAKRRPSD